MRNRSIAWKSSDIGVKMKSNNTFSESFYMAVISFCDLRKTGLDRRYKSQLRHFEKALGQLERETVNLHI